METMSVSDFKARALKVLKRVDEEQQSVVLTRRGKPVAQVIPYRESSQPCQPGALAHLLTFEGDVVTPLGEDLWDAAK